MMADEPPLYEAPLHHLDDGPDRCHPGRHFIPTPTREGIGSCQCGRQVHWYQCQPDGRVLFQLLTGGTPGEG
jgi:hypothetical protein